MNKTNIKTVRGLDLRARDEKGKEVKVFQVQWIGDYAYGVRHANQTDKEFLELFVPATGT